MTLDELDKRMAELREQYPDQFGVLEADERTASMSRHPAGKALGAAQRHA